MKTLKYTSALLTGSLAWSSIAVATPFEEECWFDSPFTHETRECHEIVEEHAEYLVEVDNGYEILDEHQTEFELTIRVPPVEDGGDPDYANRPTESNDAARESWKEFIWSKISEGETIWTHDIRMNGFARGSVWTDPNNKKDAVIVLRQAAGSAVWGELFIMEPGLTIGGGVCRSQEVPTSIWPIDAVETTWGTSSGGIFRAEGSTQRQVREFLFSVPVTTDFMVALDHSTATVTTEVVIDIGGPCTGDTVHGSFAYNPTSYLY